VVITPVVTTSARVPPTPVTLAIFTAGTAAPRGASHQGCADGERSHTPMVPPSRSIAMLRESLNGPCMGSDPLASWLAASIEEGGSDPFESVRARVNACAGGVAFFATLSQGAQKHEGVGG
jgi:hypothetical protein